MVESKLHVSLKEWTESLWTMNFWIYSRLQRCFTWLDKDLTTLLYIWRETQKRGQPLSLLGSWTFGVLIRSLKNWWNIIGVWILFGTRLWSIKPKRRSLKSIVVLSKNIYEDVFQQITTIEDIIKVKESQLKVHPSKSNREELSNVEVE